MTLAFSEYINSQPTCFPEKIWEGLISNNFSPGAFEYIEFEQAYQKKFEKSWDITATEPIISKVHTIREDLSNRWRVGMDIHFVINNRTKNRFQFAPVVKCVSVQEIEFYWFKPEHLELYPLPFDDTGNGRYCDVYIDNKVLNVDIVKKLAINDGFDSVEDFFAYFDKDFKGKIIHWTDLKY